MYQYPFNNQFNFPNQFNNQFNQREEIVKVNGENGARAIQMPPNSEKLLLDSTGPVVWLAQTDGAGYKTLTPYNITPISPEKPIDLKSLEQRIAKLEERYGKPNNADTKPKKHNADQNNG